jgi:hypothetical protein
MGRRNAVAESASQVLRNAAGVTTRVRLFLQTRQQRILFRRQQERPPAAHRERRGTSVSRVRRVQRFADEWLTSKWSAVSWQLMPSRTAATTRWRKSRE